MRRLLLVDDDDDFRAALTEEIERTGKYIVDSADCGEAALEVLDRDSFDVVILDYKMPGISGLSVLRWMSETNIDTPVVMMTMAGSESVAVEAMKLGAYDYVRKEEIDINHIGTLIDGLVERYLLKREKILRAALEHRHEMGLVTIETYHSTLASIAQVVYNSLAMVSLTLRRYESTLKPHVTDEGKRIFAQTFEALKQEYDVVEAAVKSMLDMANVLHGNFTASDYTERMKELMDVNLRAMQVLEIAKASAEGLSVNQAHPHGLVRKINDEKRP
jgi:CheY-like chemotaxis protein